MRAIALCLALILPLAAAAQDRIQVDLPGGSLVIQLDRDNFRAIVSDGRSSVQLATAYLPDVVARTAQSVLLATSTGGSMCAPDLVWVTIAPAGLWATPNFGTCGGSPEMRQTEGGPMAVMSRSDNSGISGFVFDGVTVTEVDLGLASAGVTNPRDAAQWEGKWPWDVLGAAEMEPVLLGVVSPAVLAEVRLAAVLSAVPMTRDGDWMAGAGCEAHNCNASRAGVAISTRDGRVILARWIKGQGGTLYGTPDSALPAVIQNVLNGVF